MILAMAEKRRETTQERLFMPILGYHQLYDFVNDMENFNITLQDWECARYCFP